MSNFVLIQTDTFYPYIYDCIDQINCFNNIPIYYVGPAKFKNNLSNKKNLIYIDQESVTPTDIQKEWCKSTNLSQGFWRSATERFFYLESVMRQFNLTNTFHIETDNLIFFNVEEELYKFEQNYNIAGTFDHPNRCIPGFMFYKNVDALSSYNKFIWEITLKDINEKKYDGCKLNDMVSFALFRKAYPDIIKNLPRMPKSYPMENKEDYIQNIDLFGAIFDANEIGQYLGGISPRNDYGTLGFINETCVHKINKMFNFSYERDSERRKILYLYYKCKNNNWDTNNNKEKYRVNNLHVHSKNLINFMSI